jgi:hypothetical protein
VCDRHEAPQIHLKTETQHHSSLKENLWAVFFYSAAALLFFWPALRFFSTNLIGPAEDNMFFYWALWHGSESILNPAFSFMHTHLIYFPEGISLYFCNYYYYGVFITFFLRVFFSLPLIHNLLIFHTYVVAGLGAFYLIRYLTGDYKASLLGGFVFAFNPSHFAHSLHHLTIASIQFIPFFALFFIKTAREKTKTNIFLAALFMTLNALCDWNYLVFDLAFVFLGSLYLLWQRRAKAWEALKKIIWIPVLALLFLAPLIMPMISASIGRIFFKILPGHDIYVADFFGFIVPHPYHLFSANSLIQGINGALTGNDWEKTAYLGIFNLLLIGFAARHIWKQAGKYFLGLAAFMILAMGVSPHFLGRSLPLPMPYRLIQALPFFSQARNPSRIIAYAYLFLAILAAFSLRHFLSGMQTKVRGRMVWAAVFLLVFLDFYAADTAVTPVVLPPSYTVIQKDHAGNFGILELPRDGARYMMYQTMHEIPCVQGYMGRRFEKTLIDGLDMDLKRLALRKRTFVANRVKYIVLFKKRIGWDAAKPKDASYLKKFEQIEAVYAAAYERIFSDDESAVFKVY